MNQHRTELDGWVAEWQLDQQHRARILLVHNTSDAEPWASFDLAASPDLAQMREQHPHLSRLWDAIRHQYWSEFIPRHRHS
jgi:hypothetical protein